MAQVTWDVEQDVQKMAASLVAPCDRIGRRGLAAMQAHTPVGKGVLVRSEHYAILDAAGKQIGGDTTDDNGHAIPQYDSGGMLSVFVGTNEAAEVGGRGYALNVNIGIGGHAGALFSFSAEIEMLRAVKDEIG